ncbi:HAD hydrolase-like protein [Mesobacillus maritimus]|uniref:HAD family hydrolase n=1 Tax=Mesobacillus maritimus TaxID=1643336 RepID=UPI00203ED5AF|nr:HAD family hydrolase [Mesobacillus maritimus]MCM3669693.1 HAD hydrolase-like protein [Mesobacillus maritimus]
MNWIKEIKAIIFDMDGTLYQEDTFLGRYLTYLLEDSCSEREIESVIKAAYKILNGEHFVSLDHFYDLNRNHFCTHKDLVPDHAFSWEGQRLQQNNTEYSDLFYVGDPWSIALVFAKKYGVSVEVGMNAFKRVRAEMLTPEFAIPRDERLIQALKHLDVDTKILITNSPFESGEVFLEYLDVLPYFNQTIYDGKKPKGIETIMNDLIEKGYQPEEILSIGDNPFNDLHPARKRGARTVLISDYHRADSTPWDYQVRNIDELASFLLKFGKRQAAINE